MRSAALPVTLIVAVMLGAGSAAAQDGTCGIAGRVVTPDGKPLPGAQVLLTTDPEPRWPGSFATPEGTPAAVTGADGTYVATGLEPGSYYVAAWKRGYGVGEFGESTEWHDRFTVRLRAGERAEGIDLTVLYVFRVRGRVEDHLGRPVAKARISVRVEYADGGDKEGGGGAANPDGTYDLGPLPLRGPGMLTVGGDGHGHCFRDSAPIAVVPGAVVDVPVLKALPPARVSGVVVSEAGRPCTGATVRCGSLTSAVDRDGGFELTLPPGPARLRVELREGEPLLPGPRVDWRPGENAAIRIVTFRPRTIRGRVVDARGNPRPGVAVAAVPHGTEIAWKREGESVSTSDERGEFELCDLRGRVYRVVLVEERSGWLDMVDPVSSAVVRAGARGVTLVWAPIIVKGRFGRLDDWPQVDLVGARGPDQMSRGRQSIERFRVNVREPGTYRIQIRSEGHATYVSRPLVLAPGTTLDLGPIRFRRPCVIRGVVKDAAGRPLLHAKVHFADSRTGVLYADIEGTFTDTAGRFEKGALPPGTYTVFAMTPGRALAVRRGVVVRNGSTADTELVAPEAAPLTVRVLDRDGKPVPKARLRYRPEGLPLFIGADFRTYEPPSYGAERTDGNGTARRPLLPPGHVEIEIETENGATSRASAQVACGEETRVDIRLD